MFLMILFLIEGLVVGVGFGVIGKIVFVIFENVRY